MRAEQSGGISPEGSRPAFESINWFLSCSMYRGKHERGATQNKNTAKEHVSYPLLLELAPPPSAHHPCTCTGWLFLLHKEMKDKDRDKDGGNTGCNN
jgi:hypothetical protein